MITACQIFPCHWPLLCQRPFIFCEILFLKHFLRILSLCRTATKKEIRRNIVGSVCLTKEAQRDLRLTWDWPETALRLTWDWPETDTDQRLTCETDLRDWPETNLRRTWDWPETDLRLTWDRTMRQRWRFSALEHLVPDRRTDGQTNWLPELLTEPKSYWTPKVQCMWNSCLLLAYAKCTVCEIVVYHLKPILNYMLASKMTRNQKE